MKTMISVSSILAAAMGMAAAQTAETAAAENKAPVYKERFSVFGGIGLATAELETDDSVGQIILGNFDDLDTGVAINFGGAWNVLPYLALETEVLGTINSGDGDDSDLNVTAILFGAALQTNPTQRVRLSAGASYGYFGNNLELRDNTSAISDDSDELDGSWGYQLKGGVEYRVSGPNWVGLSVRYLKSDGIEATVPELEFVGPFIFQTGERDIDISYESTSFLLTYRRSFP